MKNKLKINDIFAYIIGHYRYYIYDHKFLGFLMRKHVKEQIAWRISVMNKECYSSGSCIKCGCETPALQMANKACEGDCYPKIMGKRKWKIYRIYTTGLFAKDILNAPRHKYTPYKINEHGKLVE